ncbi:hypothetical protein PHLGIDRAFT_134389 [Phlebiopsis gigantea 11061_1 CR5-6]|uniref:Secreted protein n=1 Tax=Phlebiopsis gigantea (strain 11061_1 CR5-6) TaxID=745531 RepID=A0A0C3SFV6_PHLG1|nr:hypothetical protein PHLGIDRAFT_134389 [Phlebiopsis gigantea 11061_1 CR5-6]
MHCVCLLGQVCQLALVQCMLHKCYKTSGGRRQRPVEHRLHALCSTSTSPGGRPRTASRLLWATTWAIRTHAYSLRFRALCERAAARTAVAVSCGARWHTSASSVSIMRGYSPLQCKEERAQGEERKWGSRMRKTTEVTPTVSG